MVICILAIGIAALLFWTVLFPRIPFDGIVGPTAKTQQEVVSMATALRGYWIEYREFPRGDTINVLKVLQGQTIDGQNPRKIIFIQIHQRDLDKNGLLLDA